jgi:hypothetical protein
MQTDRRGGLRQILVLAMVNQSWPAKDKTKKKEKSRSL